MKCTSICLRTHNGLYVPVIIRAFAWITYFIVSALVFKFVLHYLASTYIDLTLNWMSIKVKTSQLLDVG
ncbi:hypothetical protein HanPSC8_Chr07g0274041 [Helianthus annuus]|nr:hypothetical protein HanPSC8_Chr07g0274041 [Helianthus annuus]